jgi:signal transduction histidine kinase
MRTSAFKLSVLYMLAFALLSSLLLGYVYWQTNHLMSRQIMQRLDGEVRGLEAIGKAGGLPALARLIERRSSRPSASIYLLMDMRGNKITGNISELPEQIRNQDGLVRFSYERDLEDMPRSLRERPNMPEFDADHLEVRRALGRVFLLPNNMQLLVGRDIGELVRFQNVMRRALLLGLGITVLLGIVGGILVSRRVLGRIEAFDKTSRAIMAGDMSERIPLSNANDELDRLATSLNAMLERIEALMKGMKEVSDNVAHDLRTPLTRLRNQVEAAMAADMNAGAAREALASTLQEADALIATFNALLLIARAEAGGDPVSFANFDAATLVADMAELYEPVIADAGAGFEINAPETLIMHGNKELIAKAVSNLFENALKYGLGQGAAAKISLSLEEKGDCVLISVSDNGQGVDPDQRDHITQRFVRLDQARSKPGSGLGLSLVRAVCLYHRGSLEILDANPGLKVSLKLPLNTKHGETAE